MNLCGKYRLSDHQRFDRIWGRSDPSIESYVKYDKRLHINRIMNKDLTTSEVARLNILNNRYALDEIQKSIGLKGVLFEGEYKLIKKQVAAFFEISERSINTCLKENSEELKKNGYVVLTGKRLKDFKLAFSKSSDQEVNFLIKSNQLGVFNFRAFLNIAMLLAKSDRAKEIRSLILDIVLDAINKRTGGGTKYINQRDEDFIITLLQNADYHKELVYALRDYVDMGKIKYITYNNKVYKSIFKEDADEYRKILKLELSENERGTMYSEVLDLIASYEAGFADELKQKSIEIGRKLTPEEADKIYANFESRRLWLPLVNKARTKMASRDLCFRDALHHNLQEYIDSVPPEDFDRFIGERSMDLQVRLEKYIDALVRLKNRE